MKELIRKEWTLLMNKKRLNETLIPLILIILFGCGGGSEELKHIKTINVGSDCYVEIFQTYSGGVYGGDLDEYFLTDSANFKFNIGKCDDSETFVTNIIDDEISIYKLSWRNELNGDTIETKVYSLSKLKQEGKGLKNKN